MWLEAVEGVLERANVSVVGKAMDSAAGISLVSDQKPNLLVTDAMRNEATGAPDFDHLRAAQEQAPGIKCIVLSSDEDPHKIEAALAAGAVAYVLKSAHPEDLASAVRQVFEQSIYRSPSVVATPILAATNSAVVAAELTGRERQILRLVADGHSNAQLARMLWVTEQTVKFHLSNVYRKINVSNRTEAARWAQLHGLLPTGDDVQISA